MVRRKQNFLLLKLLASEGKETPSLNIDGANRYPGQPATHRNRKNDFVQKIKKMSKTLFLESKKTPRVLKVTNSLNS